MAAQETYNDKVIRHFAIMTIVWGIVGMLVGVVIAAQLAWPVLNFDIPWRRSRAYGRLPHQRHGVRLRRLGAVRDLLLHRAAQPAKCACSPTGLRPSPFWGWQTVIVSAAITLPLGITTDQGIRRGRAHRHLVCRGVGRLRDCVCSKARSSSAALRHIYMDNWFYGGFRPDHRPKSAHRQRHGDSGESPPKSALVYAGVRYYMVQWWYGHNAVSDFS